MKKEFCFVLVMLFLTSFTFAEISLSDPEEIYNLGDRLYVSADGLRGAESGNLNVDLLCGNRTINLEKMSARRYSSDEDFSYSLPYKVLSKEDLEISNLSEILGECQVKLVLGSQMAVSNTFTISDDIFITASLDKASYDPGEGILISAYATKANGNLVNGFIEGMNASAFNKAMTDGFVTESFSMSESAEAGIYELGLRVYDLGKNGVLNEGFTTVSFNINQVATSIIMSLSGVEAVPGEEFTIGAEVFDQSGKEIVGTVSGRIISPKNEVIEIAIPTGDYTTIEFPINSTAGLWKIFGTFDKIGEEREFEMIRNSRMEFNITDGVLAVSCVGNWECNDTIEINIGEELQEIDLTMDLGEVRKFSLKAPQGEYDVTISDGENSINRQVLLTGNAISVKDFKEVGIFRSYSIIWIFLILVLGGVGFVLFMRYRKTRTYGVSESVVKAVDSVKGSVEKVKGGVGFMRSKVSSKVPSKVKNHVSSSLNFTNKSPTVQGLDQENYSSEDKSMMDLTKREMEGAESTLVLKGEKHLSAVISLSVKNYGNLGDHAKQSLIKIIGDSKDAKGLVDWRGDYIFIVFSPLVTKTYNNEALAAKTGFKILNELKNYNKKFNDKIEFNLGVHAGELVASKAGGKLKYTSIGNTISLAKRISDSDSEKLSVSEDVRKKLMRDLKVVRGKELGKNQIYEVSEIKNHSADEAKLKDLLKRMD